MNLNRVVAVLWTALLVPTAAAGIFEDNPPSMHLRLVAPARDAQGGAPSGRPTPTSIHAGLEAVRWHGCDGRMLTVIVEAEVELLEGVELVVPSGDWCRLELWLDDPALTDSRGHQRYAELLGDVHIPLMGEWTGQAELWADTGLLGTLVLAPTVAPLYGSSDEP